MKLVDTLAEQSLLESIVDETEAAAAAGVRAACTTCCPRRFATARPIRPGRASAGRG